MNSFIENYINLYKIQDKVFSVLVGNYSSLYLTGGTALGRYYLNHRYSDDIDLFTNNDVNYKKYVLKIRTILEANFKTIIHKNIISDDFIRIWIQENNYELKIEFVNDITFHTGKILNYNSIPIDNVENILSNKLTAIVSRDEPKDVFDVVYISLNYSFNWDKIYESCLKKAVVAEQDIAMRLETFPVELFIDKPWLKKPVDLKLFKKNLEKIIDDFILAKDNSLGKGKTAIEKAVIQYRE